MHGGRRPGAGRPKKVDGPRRPPIEVTIEKEAVVIPGRTRQTAGLTASQIADLKPLEVMLRTMRLLASEDNWVGATAVAEKAAPYMHARLATTTIMGDADAPVRIEHAVRLVDERKPVELFLNEWQPKMIEGEAAD